ncbi:hypothetical protein ABTW24_14665 [Sphingobacterium thalpophilum]|uniref:HTH luxR-type domain-containing protein n=1 Tax=Sphingobacterium thalpophilum TaxID=259 RepID=A0ABV4HH25_9SPHI
MKVRLFDQAIREINIQMGVANRLQDSIKRKNYLYAYGDLEYVYTRLGKADSVEKYVTLQLDLVTTFNEKENALEYVNTFDALGAFYTQREQYDKARVYLNKSLALVEKYKVPIYFNTMTYMGTLEQFEDNIVGALVYFNKGLANMIQVGDWDSVRDRYKFLAEYYRYYKLGNEKADLYDVAYSRLNDSLENQNRKMMDTVLNHILKSNEEESTTKVTNYVNIIKITVAILIVVIIFFVWRSRRKSKILGAKDEALQETEIINKKLMEQIGENKFDKLIDLAKNNSPEFLTLFSELYPEFINALKSKDPNLRSTELEFCAMAFLNFSTKNIAEYTYVTIRAVQVRKNRLRKKFEIPSDADFNNWMREKV